MNEDLLQDFSHEDREDETSIDVTQTDEGNDPDNVEDNDVDLEEMVRLAKEDYEDDESDDEEADDTSSEDGEGELKEQTDDGPDQTDEQTFKNEENARNAERRRQAEAERAERIRQQSPEFQFVQNLANMYGKDPQEVMATLQAKMLEQRSEREGIPVQVLEQMQRQEERIQQLQIAEQQREFQAWNQRLDTEGAALKQSYPMLSDQELHQAKAYLIQTQQLEAPLEVGAYALFGKKIVEAQATAAQNEALATAANRKSNSVITPQSGKTRQTDVLSAAEKAIAKEFGMSDEEYLKYK